MFIYVLLVLTSINYALAKEVDSILIEKHLYLSIYQISAGKSWVDENNQQYFYRILLGSIEEMVSIHLELIKVSRNDGLNLVFREEIKPNLFGVEYYIIYPEFVQWRNSYEVELIINHKNFILDLMRNEAVQTH